jgi:ubiquinone/menaquinone biosynthesis C-methylase UbiE
MLRRSFFIGLLLCCTGMALSCQRDTTQEEAARLAALLQWHPGSVVADIGAGAGKLTLAAAQRVGLSGKVYSTEINAKSLLHLRELAGKEMNITVIEGAEAGTNLPPACCDSIFMRFVYHHLTKPAEFDASLSQSLKPGARLAVIDENPRKGTSIPKGVPQNRGGHGVPQEILIRELTAAGFKVETIANDWPSRDAFHDVYCVVFRKGQP